MTNIIAMIEVRSGQEKGISYGHLRQKTIVNRQWSIKKEATHTSSKLSGSSGQSSRYTLYDHNNNMYTNWFASFQAQRIFFFCIIIAFCHLEMLDFQWLLIEDLSPELSFQKTSAFLDICCLFLRHQRKSWNWFQSIIIHIPAVLLLSSSFTF